MPRFNCIMVFLIGMSFLSFVSVKPNRIFYKSWTSLKVPEPSDMVLSQNDTTIYMVSDDDAKIYEVDLNGHVLRSSPTLGIDLEAICIANNSIYVVDETARKVLQIDPKNWQIVKTHHVAYSGGRNKGFESIGYNTSKGCFVLITEKDPIKIIELDHNFSRINEVQWDQARDVSSLTFHSDFAYLLSDEDMTVFRCDPESYEVVDRWKINVHNPEGLLFLKEELLILSDDLERLYRFERPN